MKSGILAYVCAMFALTKPSLALAPNDETIHSSSPSSRDFSPALLRLVILVALHFVTIVLLSLCVLNYTNTL